MNNVGKDYIRTLFSKISAARCMSLVLVISSLLLDGPALVCAQDRISIPEEIEWTWEVRPQGADPKLPNVLLLGDSITRNYFPQVAKDLGGIANVYLLASSTSVGDPRLPRQIAEFAALQSVTFAAVHFNNGLHGWGYTEAQFKSGFPIFLQAIRALPGHGKLIWATITPVKPEASNGASNPRIDARNAIAREFIETGGIPIDDQHALMTQHADLFEDAFHFNKAGSAMMGVQTAAIIRRALENSGETSSLANISRSRCAVTYRLDLRRYLTRRSSDAKSLQHGKP